MQVCLSKEKFAGILKKQLMTHQITAAYRNFKQKLTWLIKIQDGFCCLSGEIDSMYRDPQFIHSENSMQ